MNIREMQQGDLDRIIEITRTAWGDMTLYKLMEERHGVIGDRGWNERKTHEVKSACEKNSSHVIVAVENNSVVGYAMFWIDREDEVGHVRNNAVDPAFQGRGIGTAMTGWIVDYFRKEGLRVACVSTMLHDIAAQKVYEKWGFKEIARSIHYSTPL